MSTALPAHFSLLPSPLPDVVTWERGPVSWQMQVVTIALAFAARGGEGVTCPARSLPSPLFTTAW